MSWTFVLRPAEMVAFRECRRSWDWGARVRRGLVPRAPLAPFDLDFAIRAGLAAYYLPAMDDWNRSIVRPLAVKALHRALLESRGEYEATTELDEAGMEAWEQVVRLGTLVLHRYFAFAAAFDDFDSILANEDVWAPVPDPRSPERDLGTADGRPVRYLCRLDQLIADDDDEWWVVRHRRVRSWASDEALLDDPDGVRLVWALETAYPQLFVSGTVDNELLVTELDEALDRAVVDQTALDVPPDGAELDRRDMLTGRRHRNLRRDVLTPEKRVLESAADRPDEIAHRESDGAVRRTWIRRGHGQIHAVGLGIAEQCVDMLCVDVPVPPTPSPSTCARCAFLEPCVEKELGGDAERMLAALYRTRRDDE